MYVALWMLSALLALTLTALVLVALWGLRWKQAHERSSELGQSREDWLTKKAKRAEDALHWHVWWMRNACEGTPNDPWRPHLVRFALASLLAPSFDQFARDLHSIDGDDERPLEERNAARGILAELQAPKVPWDPSLRAMLRADGSIDYDATAPEHAPARIAEVYQHALTSWVHLLAPSQVQRPEPVRRVPPDAH